MNVKLEAYAGPLDLLLGLIEKNEIDIYDIPMAELCRQYLAALSDVPADMEGMSEFLLMAATLLEIKSRMLLPRPGRAEEEGEDPREMLVRQLVAYKHCQELAEILRNSPDAGRWLFKSPELPLMTSVIKRSPEDCLEDITADKLWEVFAEVMQRQARKVDHVRQNFGTVAREQHSVSDKIKQIKDYLQEGQRLRLSELFILCQSRSECIVTFLALLEMIRRRQAAVRQEKLFGEIEVMQA